MVELKIISKSWIIKTDIPKISAYVKEPMKEYSLEELKALVTEVDSLQEQLNSFLKDVSANGSIQSTGTRRGRKPFSTLRTEILNYISEHREVTQTQISAGLQDVGKNVLSNALLKMTNDNDLTASTTKPIKYTIAPTPIPNEEPTQENGETT